MCRASSTLREGTCAELELGRALSSHSLQPTLETYSFCDWVYNQPEGYVRTTRYFQAHRQVTRKAMENLLRETEFLPIFLTVPAAFCIWQQRKFSDDDDHFYYHKTLRGGTCAELELGRAPSSHSSQPTLETYSFCDWVYKQLETYVRNN